MAAESISNRRGQKGRQQEQGEAQDANVAQQGQSGGMAASLSEAAERARDTMSEGMGQMGERFRETTQGREGAVVLVALAAGFGLGIAIGTALVRPQHRSRNWYDRSTAESIGRRIMDRVEELLPQGITDCFHR